MSNPSPIGVFDSGVGGLTVYKALTDLLPFERFIYLGDTARLPYGTKSPETVTDYASQAAEALLAENIKLLVVACNTASAQALPFLHKALAPLPILGVIEPGAEEAARVSSTGHIAVMATEGTVRSGAYAEAIKHHRPDVDVKMLACNLMVGMAEEGWCDGPEAEAIIGRYLRELGNGFDTLVLGCTHFPLLAPTIRKLIGPSVHIVDSASTTARAVQGLLRAQGLLNSLPAQGKNRFLVTDSPTRFHALAQRFIGADIAPEHISLTPANRVTSGPKKAMAS
jgi:glutamate racemase